MVDGLFIKPGHCLMWYRISNLPQAMAAPTTTLALPDSYIQRSGSPLNSA